MKADYNSIIYAYESNNVDILSIIADEVGIAMEADNINPEQAVKYSEKSADSKSFQKSNLLLKAVADRVKALIKKIGGILDSLKRKLSNRIRLLLETDKKFYTMYNKRKSMIKPYKNVRVLSYQYNNQMLDQQLEKLMNEIVISIDKLRAIEGTSNSSSRISDIINAPQGKVLETLIEPYVKGETKPTSIQAFIKYLVEEYRGEKKEIVYTDTQIPKIESLALSTKDIANKCNGYLRKAQQAYNNIKTLEYQINRNSKNEKVINLITSNCGKAATLYNIYSTLIHSYYELKLEQSLNYRIILKKFYQF